MKLQEVQQAIREGADNALPALARKVDVRMHILKVTARGSTGGCTCRYCRALGRHIRNKIAWKRARCDNTEPFFRGEVALSRQQLAYARRRMEEA